MALVGIDLGTTHTVVAHERDGTVAIFSIPQRVDRAAVEARPLLPSALYAPTADEGDRPWIVGEWARRRGAEAPSRAVTSSKSWLAHGAVDRNAPILPWGDAGSEDGDAKISPVDAAATILGHVRDAWDRAHPETPLARCEVVLTVPASFDEAARALTIEATRRAGLPDGVVRLLEEPQAAFLDWAEKVGSAGLAALLGEGDAREVLVVDVGGGTTDLSLLEVARDRMAPLGVAVSRRAVGDHLLLGGDNVDLAIAHLVEPRLTGGERLSPIRFAQLVAAARNAKEILLAVGSTLESTPITLLGEGSRLVGGARSTTLARGELDAILDGFFPHGDLAPRPTRARSGFVAFGLPYASDPAITRHVAAFLARHAPIRQGEPRSIALLLAGGVFHAPTIIDRLVRAIEALRGVRPEILAQGDPDLAVARGAVAHGRARRGEGLRIGGGASRSYFVGIGGEPGAPRGGRRAVCVIPRGTEPGDRKVVEGRSFALVVGRSARFDLFATAGVAGRIDRVGDVVPVDDDLDLLPPIVTAIPGAKGELAVRIEGELSEVGTLDLECVEDLPAGIERRPRRFRLGFELRGVEASEPTRQPRSKRATEPSEAIRDRLDDARAKIDRVFGKAVAAADGREAKALIRELERILGERATWSIVVVRALFDALRPGIAHRRRSADHERVFFQLAGFLLRPGFGDPLDPQRVRAIEGLWEQRLAFDDGQGWRAWWIAWRRIAGGLSEFAQTRIRDTLDPFLAVEEIGLPSARPRKKPKGIRAEPLEEVLLLASNLERIAVPRRIELGHWLVERSWGSRDPSVFSAIGRIGARVPAYDSAHRIVPPKIAEGFVEHLLRPEFAAVPTLPFALVQLARKTGDRARDLGDEPRRRVVEWLERHAARAEWIRMVREVVEVDDAQRNEAFGEALPSGLRLVG
jgi:hypothetical protein